VSAYADTGVFGVYAGTGSGEVTELMPLIADELNKVRLSVDEDEVARARAQLKSSILMCLESTSSRAEQMARQLMIFGRPIPPEEAVAKIEGVDAEAIKNVAARIFQGAPTVAALGPITHVEAFDKIEARLN